MHSFMEPLGHGITLIDTGLGRPRFDAAYLIVQDGRAAYVDTGTNHGVPRLLAALEAQGLAPEAVDWLIVTHVHLDHAGGAGRLLQQLPHARLVVHPRGARHMIDPGALSESARAVYGAEMFEREYGTPVSVPAERVHCPADGETIQLADRSLRFIDTPGHARHHHCIWDEASRGWFTGDTFGISYPELLTEQGRHIIPSTTPVQFEPEALRHSIGRLLETQPERVYLTHFGMACQVERLAELMLRQMNSMVALGESLSEGDASEVLLREKLRDLYGAELLHAKPLINLDQAMELLALDIQLNAQGLSAWLEKSRSRLG